MNRGGFYFKDKSAERFILDHPDMPGPELARQTGLGYETVRKRRDTIMLCDRLARKIQAMLKPLVRR